MGEPFGPFDMRYPKFAEQQFEIVEEAGEKAMESLTFSGNGLLTVCRRKARWKKFFSLQGGSVFLLATGKLSFILIHGAFFADNLSISAWEALSTN